jgi:hypothetical protein
MAHSTPGAPGPRDLPVGYVATAEQGTQVTAMLEEEDAFGAREYADVGRWRPARPRTLV